MLVTVVAAYLANVFQRRALFSPRSRKSGGTSSRRSRRCSRSRSARHPARKKYFTAFARSRSCSTTCARSMRTSARRAARSASTLTRHSTTCDAHCRRSSPRPVGKSQPRTASRARRDLASVLCAARTFLEELDLEAPDNPCSFDNGRRMKKPGAPGWARRRQTNQHRYQDRTVPADARITPFLTALDDKEQTTAKPWREVEKKPVNATAEPVRRPMPRLRREAIRRGPGRARHRAGVE